MQIGPDHGERHQPPDRERKARAGRLQSSTPKSKQQQSEDMRPRQEVNRRRRLRPAAPRSSPPTDGYPRQTIRRIRVVAKQRDHGGRGQHDAFQSGPPVQRRIRSRRSAIPRRTRARQASKKNTDHGGEPRDDPGCTRRCGCASRRRHRPAAPASRWPAAKTHIRMAIKNRSERDGINRRAQRRSRNCSMFGTRGWAMLTAGVVTTLLIRPIQGRSL